MSVFTVLLASELMGVHPTHVTLLLRRGSLVGKKWGNGWMVDPESVKKYMKDGRKPKMGRPKATDKK